MDIPQWQLSSVVSEKQLRVFTLNNNNTRTTSSYFVLMFSFLTLTIKTTDKNVFKVTKNRVKQGFNLFRVNNKNIRMASSDVVFVFSLPTVTVKKKGLF